MMKYIEMSALMVFAVFLASPLNAADYYTFGVVPQQPPQKLARLWIPVIKKLENETGLKIRFQTAPSISLFEHRLAVGRYDFAYVNPYHYVTFQKKAGYQVFAKEAGRKLRGIIVAKKGMNIKWQSRQQLALPAPAAFGASLLTQSMLKKKGLDYEPEYLGSHDSVYIAVAQGLYPFGGGVPRTLENMPPAIKEQLVVVHNTAGYTPHAFIAHRRVPKKDITAIYNNLAALNNSEEGRNILEKLSFDRGITAATDEEYKAVRKLNIRALEHLSQNGL